MAAWDTWTQRRGMLGWGIGGMLPEATGGFDGVDSQLFLALPGQHAIENGEIPDLTADGTYPRIRIGIQIGL